MIVIVIVRRRGKGGGGLMKGEGEMKQFEEEVVEG